MRKMNDSDMGTLFIINDKEELVGIVTDGDIRRALLRGLNLETKINTIMNPNPLKINSNWTEEQTKNYISSDKVKNKVPKWKILVIPIVDEKNKICGIKYWNKEEASVNDFLPKKGSSVEYSKILIFGGAGYIGSILACMLIEKGYKVKVFDCLLYGDDGIKNLYGNPNFELFKGDITSIPDIVEAISDVQVIVHLAAIVGDPAGSLNPTRTLSVNYFATKVVGEIAKYLGVSKYIFASTCSVYGYTDQMITEEDALNPLSLYAETKILSEKALLDLNQNGFKPVIMRFATAYGLSPRMRFDLVVNLLIAKAVRDGEITVFGNGLQRRPFIHIRDLSQAIIDVIDTPVSRLESGIYNVGSTEQNMNIKTLSEIIKKRITEAELKFIPENEDDRSYDVSFRKFQERFGFKTKYDIDFAIEEIRGALTNGKIGDYKARKYSNYKILKDN
jgi:nucleoside-diphosphate-sugar epimerase